MTVVVFKYVTLAGMAAFLANVVAGLACMLLKFAGPPVWLMTWLVAAVLVAVVGGVPWLWLEVSK